MNINKDYCMNSFLQFRYIYNNYLFKKDLIPNYYKIKKKYKIHNANDLEIAIKDYIEKNVDEKTALMLSSGIDSAILAKYMPKGSKVFTLKCIASEPTTDETNVAKKIANYNNLKQEIIEITWSDYEKYCDSLLKHKKAPFHSIEVQIYKAALIAKEQGYTKLLFGESADAVFGGLDGLLSQEWKLNEFAERYNNVNPFLALKKANIIYEPYKQCLKSDYIDVHEYINTNFFIESVNSYMNACATAGVEFLSPYVYMEMAIPLDLERIRNGESKYLIRELFKKIYPNMEMTKKIPMPRPIELWLKDWEGPNRKEFIDNCIANLKGDQKWLVYILEKFLNYYEIEEEK